MMSFQRVIFLERLYIKLTGSVGRFDPSNPSHHLLLFLSVVLVIMQGIGQGNLLREHTVEDI